MGIIIDIVVIAILALSIFLGYKRGLIKVIFNLCAFLVALILTFILYKPVASFVIQNTDLYDNIKQVVLENGITEKKEDVIDNNAGVDKYIEKYTYNAITEAKNDVVKSAADTIALNAVNVMVSIVLFIVIRILLIFARFLVEALAELPIVKQFNELGGALYGAITGLITIYAILAIVFFIVSINGFEYINEAIDMSIITKYLYGNNIILNIFF